MVGDYFYSVHANVLLLWKAKCFNKNDLHSMGKKDTQMLCDPTQIMRLGFLQQLFSSGLP